MLSNNHVSALNNPWFYPDNSDFLKDPEPIPYRSIKRRRRLSKLETKTLNDTYNVCSKPNSAVRRRLAEQLAMTPRAVQIWFQNRRAKTKRDREDQEDALDASKATTRPLTRSQSMSSLPCGSSGSNSATTASPNTPRPTKRPLDIGRRFSESAHLHTHFKDGEDDDRRSYAPLLTAPPLFHPSTLSYPMFRPPWITTHPPVQNFFSEPIPGPLSLQDTSFQGQMFPDVMLPMHNLPFQSEQWTPMAAPAPPTMDAMTSQIIELPPTPVSPSPFLLPSRSQSCHPLLDGQQDTVDLDLLPEPLDHPFPVLPSSLIPDESPLIFE
ncbi:hypothetical protein BZG36_02527 [Bifiguratus adelaidae]|uniref:Homeobox domain-containing protein n=1 Tax=Bifiguratus adelaidae TaxID=1938954 RepID=A0A261Y2P2_9FUNG|nr:hypothetical protein BZG36_02527 [Bifiguratus adelaidae]